MDSQRLQDTVQLHEVIVPRLWFFMSFRPYLRPIVPVVTLLLFLPNHTLAQLSIESAGVEQAIFVHDRDACKPLDIPDAPARAFRDASGHVHLFAAHYINYGYVGPN